MSQQLMFATNGTTNSFLLQNISTTAPQTTLNEISITIAPLGHITTTTNSTTITPTVSATNVSDDQSSSFDQDTTTTTSIHNVTIQSVTTDHITTSHSTIQPPSLNSKNTNGVLLLGVDFCIGFYIF